MLPLRTAKICENKSYCKLITTKKREFSQYEDETLNMLFITNNACNFVPKYIKTTIQMKISAHIILDACIALFAYSRLI